LLIEPGSSEEHIPLPSPVNDNLIDNSLNQSSLHAKQSAEKETNARTG